MVVVHTLFVCTFETQKYRTSKKVCLFVIVRLLLIIALQQPNLFVIQFGHTPTYYDHISFQLHGT